MLAVLVPGEFDAPLVKVEADGVVEPCKDGNASEDSDASEKFHAFWCHDNILLFFVDAHAGDVRVLVCELEVFKCFEKLCFGFMTATMSATVFGCYFVIPHGYSS